MRRVVLVSALVVAVVASLMPTAVAAPPVPVPAPVPGAVVSAPLPPLVPAVPGELPERRTESSLTVRNADGSLTQSLFTGAVHYRDADGRWQPISTDVSGSAPADGYTWGAFRTAMPVQFKATAEDGMVRWDVDGQPFTLSLVDAQPVRGVRQASSVTYPGVLAGVDARYDVLADGLKETLVLADASRTSFRFVLSAPPDVRADRRDDGSWVFTRPASGEPLFVLPPAVAVDSSGAPADGSPNATLDVMGADGGGFVVDVAVDATWLAAPERVFPVLVDPTVQRNPAADVSVKASCPTCPATADDRLRVGTTNSSTWRSAARFDIGFLPTNADIHSATLNTRFDQSCLNPIETPEFVATCGTEAHQLNLHQVTGAWTTTSPASAFTFSPTTLASASLPAPTITAPTISPRWLSFNALAAVSSWRAGAANNGLLLKRSAEPSGASGPALVGGRYVADATLRPRLDVNFDETVRLLEPELVHSDGAELRWTRYAAESGVAFASYDVYRDGVVIARITDRDRTTFADTTAAAGRSYGYVVRVNGLGASNTVWVTTPPAGQARLSVTPDAAAGQATHVRNYPAAGVACGDYGAMASLPVGAGPDHEARGLVRFDLSAIPAGSSVTAATLSLSHDAIPTSPAEGVTVDVHAVTADWTEGAGSGGCDGEGATWAQRYPGAAWASAGVDHDPAVAASVTSSAGQAAGVDSFNVVGLVQDWASARRGRHGLLLRARGGAGLVTYRSDDEATDPTRRPKLSVTFTDGRMPVGPVVKVTAPAQGQQILGAVTLAADASDNSNVASVQFFADGGWVGAAYTAPYQVTWNPTVNGDYTITALATDDAGNTTTSAGVDVVVDRSAVPTVSFTTPVVDPLTRIVPNGSPVTVSAGDDRGVDRVEVLLDDDVLAVLTSAPYTFVWNQLTMKPEAFDGPHTLTARAYDAQGQVASADLAVVVANTTSTKYRASFDGSVFDPLQMRNDPVETGGGGEAAAGPAAASTPATVPVTVKVKNDSNQVWDDAVVHVGYKWISDDPSIPVGLEGHEAFVGDIGAGQERSLTLQVQVPDLPVGVDRHRYRLRLDMFDTAVGGGTFFHTFGSKPAETPATVEKPDASRLGLERYFHYRGGEAGAGMQHLANVDTGNLSLRWTPWASPGRGLSTVLDLTYNSRDRHSTSVAGNGFQLAVSGLVPLGQRLRIHPKPSGKDYVEFVDADGTTQRFDAIPGTGGPDGVVGYTQPPGVYLFLRQTTTAATASRKWALTRPDRVTFYFDQDGYPTAVDDGNTNNAGTRAANTLTFGYGTVAPADDPGGDKKRITTVTDAGNQKFTITYWTKDERVPSRVRGRVRQITDHSGSVLAFDYYDDGNLLRLTQRGGTSGGVTVADRSFVFIYTTPNLDSSADVGDYANPNPHTPSQSSVLSEVRDPNGAFTNFSYVGTSSDDYGRVAGVLSRDWADTQFSYATNAAGQRVTTVTDPTSGSVYRTSTYTVDDRGRVVRIVNPLAEATTVGWTGQNQVASVTREPKAGFAGTTATYTYDDNGYLETFTDEVGNTTELTYTHLPASLPSDVQQDNATVFPGRDAHISQLATKTSPEGVATAEATAPTDYQWDFTHSGSRLVKVTEPADADGVRHDTVYGYFDDGTLKTVTDANGRTSAYGAYDANGLPETITDPLGRLTRLDYDNDGLVVSVQDPEHARYAAAASTATQLTYDSFHRLRRQSTPKSTRFSPGELLWTGADYDANDNTTVAAQAHLGAAYGPAPGDLATMTYDVMDRLRTATGPDTEANPVAGQPPLPETTSFTYDLAGRTTTMTTPLGVASPTADDYLTRYTYDELDRVTREARGLDTTAPQYTHRCYDAAGDLVRVVGPNQAAATVSCADATLGFDVAMTYDKAHRLLTVDDAEATRGVHTYTYDRNDNLRTVTNRSGDVQTRTYDQRDRLVRVDEPFQRARTSPPTPARAATTLTGYDGVGNRVRTVSPRGYDASQDKTTFDDYVTRYAYDAADQLIRVDLPTDDDTAARYTHFGYDLNGRLDWTTLPVAKGPLDPATDLVAGPNGTQIPRDDVIAAADRTHYDYYDPGWIRTDDGGATPPVRYDYTPEGWQALRVPLTPQGLLNGQPSQTERVVWTYEDDGQLALQVVRKDGRDATASYTYDRNNRLVHANDAIGALVATQGPVVAESTYDTLDRLDKTRERRLPPAGSPGPWRFTRFTYDRHDNVLWRYDNGEENDAGVQSVPPRANEFVYDQDDWLIQSFDRATTPGLTAAELTDDLRTDTLFSPTGQEIDRRVYRYDPTIAGPDIERFRLRQVTTWDHHANGELAAMTVRAGPGLDSPVKQQHTVGYLDDAGNYANGNRTSDLFILAAPSAGGPCQTAPATCTTSYVYDARDRLVEERRAGAAAYSGHTVFDLTAAGSVDLEREYNADGQVTRTRDYEHAGTQLKKLTDSDQPGPVTYGYDGEGNLECVVTDATPPATCKQRTGQLVAAYRYDKLNRLEGFDGYDTVGATTPTDTATYTYDALDRVFSQTETHNGQPQRTTTLSYLGLTNTPTRESKYLGATPTGTPESVNDYGYDAFMNRVSLTRTQAATTEQYTYSYDVHGSVSLLVNDTAGVKASYGYRAYGDTDDELSDGDTDDDNPFNPYRYTNKRYDSGSATLDMGARRFGPDIAGFLQQDRYLGALDDLGLATDPLTQNRYSLAGGNPISYVETDGHAVTSDGGGGAAQRPKLKATGGKHRRAEERWQPRPNKGGALGGLRDTAVAYAQTPLASPAMSALRDLNTLRQEGIRGLATQKVNELGGMATGAIRTVRRNFVPWQTLHVASTARSHGLRAAADEAAYDAGASLVDAAAIVATRKIGGTGGNTPNTARAPIRVNLGGEGEVAGAINVQPARIGGSVDAAVDNAKRVAAQSGQPVVMAEGNRLPFGTGSVDEVWTNNVPVGKGGGYFGPRFDPDEILRILRPGGSWLGNSAP